MTTLELMNQIRPMLITSLAAVLKHRAIRDDGGHLADELARNGLAPIALHIEKIIEGGAALAECVNAIRGVFDAVNEGTIDLVHMPDDDKECPEDDTCECAIRSTTTALQLAYDHGIAVLKRA